jgi:lysophospholipid acyltransferase (LPLAT)-like uncharacterized protein
MLSQDIYAGIIHIIDRSTRMASMEATREKLRIRTRAFRGTVNKIFGRLIRVMASTVKFECEEIDLLTPDKVVGFWHGDVQGALALLRVLRERDVRASAITTTEWRGDVLAKIISHYGHKPLRMPNGMEMRHKMKEVLEATKDTSRFFAMALDGPSGPRHQPKSILFRLASDAKREFITITFRYSRAITVTRRWDMYKLPLPFSTVYMDIHQHGVLERGEVPVCPLA